MRRSGRSRFERLAQVARACARPRQAAQSGRMTVSSEGRGHGVRAAVGGGLRLGIGERGGRADQRAGEAVAADVAAGVEDEAHGDGRAVGAVDQRAEVGRELAPAASGTTRSGK